jgi:hypothetical protein
MAFPIYTPGRNALRDRRSLWRRTGATLEADPRHIYDDAGVDLGFDSLGETNVFDSDI